MGGVQTLIFLSQSGNDEVKVFPCIKKTCENLACIQLILIKITECNILLYITL